MANGETKFLDAKDCPGCGGKPDCDNDPCLICGARTPVSSLPVQQLRVWWIPQIPGKPFHVAVSSVEEGVKIMDVLAYYDIFQFENRIKPDYANAGGLQMLDEDGNWCDWYLENCDGYWDDPQEYLKDTAA